MSQRAAGPFDVKMTPQEGPGDPTLARFALDKTYHGDLEATSVGAMLSGGGSVQGSAGYVAIERVTGTLAGRSGAFTLMHTGVMDRGTPSLSIIVIPDSATGELEGLKGTMGIEVGGGKHVYAFDYSLPD